MNQPLFLKKPVAANSPTDPDDALVVKRSLERLGYYERPSWGLGDFTDQSLFKGSERFQQDHALTVDGLMYPNGETAQALGQQLIGLSERNNTDLSNRH